MKKGGSKSKKKSSSGKLNLIELEENQLLKQFNIMENALHRIIMKPTNKIQQIQNVSPNGHVEKILTKSVPEKKPRKNFNGCSLQTKVTVYESTNPSSDKDEYYEVKKIYRKCPKKIDSK
jgi:hypothetical protein